VGGRGEAKYVWPKFLQEGKKRKKRGGEKKRRMIFSLPLPREEICIKKREKKEVCPNRPSEGGEGLRGKK